MTDMKFILVFSLFPAFISCTNRIENNTVFECTLSSFPTNSNCSTFYANGNIATIKSLLSDSIIQELSFSDSLQNSLLQETHYLIKGENSFMDVLQRRYNSKSQIIFEDRLGSFEVNVFDNSDSIKSADNFKLYIVLPNPKYPFSKARLYINERDTLDVFFGNGNHITIESSIFRNGENHVNGWVTDFDIVHYDDPVSGYELGVSTKVNMVLELDIKDIEI